MLDMCRELGFAITALPNNATLLTARKSLVRAHIASGDARLTLDALRRLAAFDDETGVPVIGAT